MPQMAVEWLQAAIGFLVNGWRGNTMPRTPGLTPRQRTFLEKLQELYREHKAPVHYTAVAERLGVNRFSAYDMLKVLEKKGFASSSYALAAGHSGPGRSLVVFSPTPEAAAVTPRDSDAIRLGEDWQKIRNRVLSRLQDARDANPREAISDLLALLPDRSIPIAFCTEMIGVLLLNLQRVRARAGLNPFEALATLQERGDTLLESLAGLSVGATLATDDEAGSSLTRRLFDHVHQYQTSLGRLGGDARRALAQFLEEALDALD
jgi:hypothetical protein